MFPWGSRRVDGPEKKLRSMVFQGTTDIKREPGKRQLAQIKWYNFEVPLQVRPVERIQYLQRPLDSTPERGARGMLSFYYLFIFILFF